MNVAQISEDEKLAEWLLERGADSSIEPLDKNLIEEYLYLGESDN